MRRFTLKALSFVAALVGAMPVSAQDSEVTEVLYPTCDVQVRSDNKNYNKADGTAIEMRNTYDADGNLTARFAGLMSFTVPVKAGYSVKSATLRLVTERVKNGGLAVYTLDGAISSSDTYGTQESNIDAALQNDAIASQKANGKSGRATFDSQAEGTTYDDWKNELDITATVQTLTGGALNLLLCNNVTTTGKEGVNVYTDEATATTINAGKQIPKFTFEENDLRPQLTIVYEIDEAQKVESVYPTCDVQVRSDSKNYNKADGTAIEMRNTYDADGNLTARFAGLMSFTIPTKVGYSIQSATLRLVTERVKNGGLAVYTFGGDISSSDTYGTQESNIDAALKNDAIVSQNVNGVSGRATFDGQAEGTTYDQWKNELDITSTVQALTGGTLNLLLCNNTTTQGKEGINVYTDEASATTINEKQQPKFTFEEDALRPMLTVVYKKTTDGIEQIEEAATRHDGAIYTISGVRVNKPIQKGIYIQNGKKFIVR